VKRELLIIFCGEVADITGYPTYDLSCLNLHLESLTLWVKRVVNYHLLTNLRFVEFCGCDSITDVSCFQHADTVTFYSCRNVVNVNSLMKVKELVLENCSGVTDVSSLGSVKRIQIGNCRNLHNLSGLTTVHTLTISGYQQNLLFETKHFLVFSPTCLPSHFSLGTNNFEC
jgi:hypothetical protein